MPLLVFLLQLAFPQLIEPNTIVLPSRDWATVVAKVAPSVVPVQADIIGSTPVPIGTPGAYRKTVCTATVIDRNEYVLLTEKHCLMEWDNETEVLFEGIPEVARFYTPDSELALVKTKGRNIGWKNIALRKEQVWAGTELAVLGYGVGQPQPLFGAGYVVGFVGREMLVTVPFTRGHSGSPIFDRDGKLVSTARGFFIPYEDIPFIYHHIATPSEIPEFIARGVAAFKKRNKEGK